MEFRQRHPDGDEQMMKQLLRHFRPPRASIDAYNFTQFDNYLYLTQATQSLCYSAAIGYWRRLKSDPVAKTMGVIYWQLNDVWQGWTCMMTNF